MATQRTETDRSRQTGEPRLKVGAPTVLPSRRSRVRRLVPRVVAGATALCALVVFVQGHVALPFTRIVTIEAKMASKADYFEDPEVQRLLVRVRLRRDSGTVTPNRALLADAAADEVVLSEIGEFVMITGRFEAQGSRGETLVMRAPYGDGEEAAHLRVVLRVEGLRTPDRLLPEGEFQAHCLGKVTSWRSGTREVVLQYPVAVFQ